MGVCVNECPRYRSCFSLCFIFLNYILFPIYILKDSSSFWANLLWQIVQLVKFLLLGGFDTSHFSVETSLWGISPLAFWNSSYLLSSSFWSYFISICFGKSPLALSESFTWLTFISLVGANLLWHYQSPQLAHVIISRANLLWHYPSLTLETPTIYQSNFREGRDTI